MTVSLSNNPNFRFNVIGAVRTFLGLDDTPDSYASSASKLVAVNSGGTGLEFRDEQSPPFITPQDFGAAGNGVTNDTTALQAAVDYAIAQDVILRIPPGRYNYTAPLTIDGSVTIRGDSVRYAWGSGVFGVGINIPELDPPLLGAVLCPSSNGQNGVDITGGALEVHLSNLGMEFQTPFVGTGHAFCYDDDTTDLQGLTASIWQNLKVWGHDGDHYAYNLTNSIYSTFTHIQGFGGGLIHFKGKATVWHYGNAVFTHPYGQVIVAGTAHGIYVEATNGAATNLMVFIRPQITTSNENTAITGQSAPTSAQKTYTMSDDALGVTLIAPDMETTVSSNFEWVPHPSNTLITTGGVFPPATVPVTLLSTPQVLANIPGSNMQVQSGSASNGAGTGSITFPFPFSNACLWVGVTNTNATMLARVGSGTMTKTGFDLVQSDGGDCYYFAYGY